MSKHIDKYLHQNMDKEAGLQHAFKRTKIVATVGPACDTYDKLLALVKSWCECFSSQFFAWYT
jgi:pyruvate kinase